MARPKAEEGNDFDINLEELGSSWRRSVCGVFDKEKVEKFKAFLSKTGSNFWEENIKGVNVAQGLKDLWENAKKLASKGKKFLTEVKDGAVELFNLIRGGKWGEIGKIWGEVYEENPAAWLAGSIATAGAAALGALGIAKAGSAMAAVPFIATGLTKIGAFKAWVGGGAAALMKNPLVQTLGVAGMGSWLGAFTQTAPKVYNFDWQISDEAYQKAIDQSITNLYEPAGEFLGRASGAFIAARLGGARPPRAQVDVTTLAIMWEMGDDEIREEIEDAATEFMHAGVRTFMGIGATYLYTEARHMIKSAYSKLPESMRKSFEKVPWLGKGADGKKANLDDAIENWGNKGNQSWSIKKEIDLEGKIESVEDEKMKNFLEGFFENFWDTFSDCVSYSSAFKGAY